jgi:hypothetical protein
MADQSMFDAVVRMDVRTSISSLFLSNMITLMDEAARKANVPINNPEFQEHCVDFVVTLTDHLLERLKR